MRRLLPGLIFLMTIIALVVIGSGPCGAVEVIKRFDSIPSGFSSEQIDVKFVEGAAVANPKSLLPPDLKVKVKKISPLFSVEKDKLNNLKLRGENLSQKKLPSLSLWYRIKLKPDTDPVEFMNRLLQLGIAEIAEPTPLPAPPPDITPDFASLQGYLAPATNGIDAEYAWTIPGGDGTPVKIYDVEYSWNQNHEDLAKAKGVALLLNPGDTAVDPHNDNNHGTAVLGELIATNDTKGVTGISYGAQIGLAPADTSKLGYNVANAIILSVADGEPGDVILIEQQTCVCGLTCNDKTQVGYGPSEWSTPVFEAIQTAVANGFVMVEAAGNGAVNLDQTACGDFFNPSVQDSGAIIVGAGMPPGESDRSPESFTSYGSRVNVQGWGSNIVTTGYGDLYKNPSDETNPDFWYTQTFGGTSGASPMMTGAAADLQGISLSRGVLLTPGEIRSIFIETGSPQQGDMTRHIGPRPNLWLAVNQLANYSISGTVTDSKGSPLVGVSMVLGGAESATTLTAFDGTYYFSGLSNGDYTVTPGYSQCSFTPVSISVNINGAEVTGQNFTGTCTPSYSCRFTAKPASGKVPFTVKFKGSSTGISKVKSWLWNFGDETTGTSQNPSHTYESGGTYTVLLTVTGATPGVKATGIQKNCITVYETPMAGFTAAPLTGKAPLKVQFTDQSLGAAKWLWKFGDNQTSKEQNPVHTYRKAGRYTVGLTVTGPGGTNSMTKSGYITVTR